ncbi:hypothetical protein HG530_012260 [Fusarium avenaceum]|nr:hypothetical protein HG530_012260 [Fusarium avenaceum]
MVFLSDAKALRSSTTNDSRGIASINTKLQRLHVLSKRLLNKCYNHRSLTACSLGDDQSTHSLGVFGKKMLELHVSGVEVHDTTINASHFVFPTDKHQAHIIGIFDEIASAEKLALATRVAKRALLEPFWGIRNINVVACYHTFEEKLSNTSERHEKLLIAGLNDPRDVLSGRVLVAAGQEPRDVFGGHRCLLVRLPNFLKFLFAQACEITQRTREIAAKLVDGNLKLRQHALYLHVAQEL